MYKTVAMFLALAVIAYSAEISQSYALLEKHTVFQPDLKSEPVGIHAVNDIKHESEHPVYRENEGRNESRNEGRNEDRNEGRNQGRARIEPVRSFGPVIKHDAMLADQPAAPTEVNRVDDAGILGNGYIPGTGDVAYPDIPYAPGYFYDNGYSASNNYDDPSTYLMDPDTSTFSLLWGQVPDARTMVGFVGRTISWVFNSIFILFLGSLLTVGVCTYTNLCTIAFNGVGPIHEEVRALITPERLEKIGHAADFVKTAIDKYQKIQKVPDANGFRRRRAIFNY